MEALVAPAGAADAPDVVWHAWRSGDLMVMGADAQLPDRCVKTDQPARGQSADIVLFWHPPGLYLLLLLNLVVYVVVARLVGTSVVVHVGISDAVLSSSRRARALTWVLLFGGAAGWAAAAAAETPALFWVGLVLMVAAIPVYLVRGRLIRVTKLEDESVWLAGVHPDYLARLPEWAR
jgi:hypothetical protein